MNNTIRTTIACVAAASIAFAATSQSQKHLTTVRVAELTARSETPAPKAYKVDVSALGNATLPGAKPEAEIVVGREVRFPVAFEPPHAVSGTPAVTPTTPTAFETINTGWTIHLTAKPQGKLVAVYGVADYVEAQLVAGGYGATAGPIYSEQDELLTYNKLDQPKLQTTTTRFHIFAVPGESYEVTLYRGSKPERHTIKVSAE